MISPSVQLNHDDISPHIKQATTAEGFIVKTGHPALYQNEYLAGYPVYPEKKFNSPKLYTFLFYPNSSLALSVAEVIYTFKRKMEARTSYRTKECSICKIGIRLLERLKQYTVLEQGCGSGWRIPGSGSEPKNRIQFDKYNFENKYSK